MIRRPPRSTQSRSSAASDVYKRQVGEATPDVAHHIVEIVALDLVQREVRARWIAWPDLLLRDLVPRPGLEPRQGDQLRHVQLVVPAVELDLTALGRRRVHDENTSGHDSSTPCGVRPDRLDRRGRVRRARLRQLAVQADPPVLLGGSWAIPVPRVPPDRDVLDNITKCTSRRRHVPGAIHGAMRQDCLLYTSPSPRDGL